MQLLNSEKRKRHKIYAIIIIIIINMQRVTIVSSLKDEVKKVEETITTIQKDTAELHKLENTVQDDLTALIVAPTNLPREMDKIKKLIL